MLGIALGLAVLLGGPTSSSPPSVTGTLQQGARLTATAGTWAAGGTITYAYQWYRCDPNGAHCSSIHGATKGTYTEVRKDVGKTIGLSVRATDKTGTTTAYAPLAGLVAAPGAVPVATKQPPESGEPIVGQGLKAEAATWSATPAALKYAWLRCNANGRLCTAVAGATTDTYTVTADDAGHVLLAAVTAGKQTVLSLSAGVVRATPGPVPSSRPDRRRHAATGQPAHGDRRHVGRKRDDHLRLPVVPLRRDTAPTAAPCTAPRKGRTRSSQPMSARRSG